MTGMEHAIEKAARVIQQARDAGIVYDDAGEPLSAAETIARALADAGLIAPVPLTEVQAEAWDEGAQAQAAAYGMDRDTGPNPYRNGAGQ